MLMEFKDIIHGTSDGIKMKNPDTNRWVRIFPATTAGNKLMQTWIDRLDDSQSGGAKLTSPLYQEIGGYVCINKETLGDIGMFLKYIVNRA